jgi:hypothetical protein
MRSWALFLAGLLVSSLCSVRPTDASCSFAQAKAKTSECKLSDGKSEHLSLTAGSKTYFWFEVAQADLNLAAKEEATAILTKISGQSEAHVYKPARTNDDGPGDWSTVRSGSEIIAMQKDCGGMLGCTLINTAGTYVIRVSSGSSTSSVTRLLFSWNDHPITLAPDEPQIEDVDYNEFEYFTFNPTASTAHLIKTSISGYSYMIVAQGKSGAAVPAACHEPTLHSNCPNTKITKSYARDADIPLTGLTVGKPVFIGIHGRTNPETVYTLIVTVAGGNVTLVDGVPQAGGLVEKHLERFYRLETEGTHHKLSISVNPSEGYVSLYVNFCPATQTNSYHCRNPTRSSSQWKSVSDTTGGADEQSVMIDPNRTPYYHTTDAGAYFIMVYAETTARYTISATSSHNALTLQNGQSLHENVQKGKYEYFKIILSPGLDLQVGLTTYAGDPDLYLSCKLNLTNSDAGFPSKANFEWQSKSSGNDVISVAAQDSCYSKNHGQNTIFAAVYGYYDSVFTISALAGNNTLLELEDGRPIEWIVARSKFSNFYFYTAGLSTGPGSPSLNLELTPQNCDLDLYVIECGASVEDAEDCDAPSLTQYTYKSTGTQGSESLSINVATGTKYIRIGVYGFQAGEFSMAAWTTTPLVLMEGQPVMGTVEKDHYRYFKFHVEHPTDITITLTPLTSDCDLYVSNQLERPTKAIRYHRQRDAHGNFNESWYSARSGTRVDEVTIKNAPSPYEYIVAVYGYRNASFTIQGRSSDDKITNLGQGLPQGGEVDKTGWKYYRVMAPAHQGGILRVVTSISEGKISLYANKCVGRSCGGAGSTQVVDKRPGQGVYQDLTKCDINSGDSFNGASLRIDVDAHSGEDSVAYIVGVYGEVGHSEFTITTLVTGGDGHSIITLQSGAAVSDFVEKNQLSYYRFQVFDTHKDLSIAVTPFSGDPDIFVSLGEKTSYPNRTNYMWSHRSIGTDIITIYEDDEKACKITPDTPVCEYFIGVEGYNEVATYTIMAYLNDNTPITLQRGIPQSGHVNETEGRYYSFTITDKHENLVVSVTPNDDGDPDLYIQLGSNRSHTVGRKNGHYDFSSSNWREQETIEIIHTSPKFSEYCGFIPTGETEWSCQVNIFVYGFHTSSYDIVATTNDASIRLRDWRALPATVDAKSVEYFEFDVDRPGQDTYILLTPTNGDVDLYVGIDCNFTQKTGNWVWRSIEMGERTDAVEIKHTDTKNTCAPSPGKPCRFCIKVNNIERHAVSFSITAGTDSGAYAQTLPAGRQISGQVDSKKFRYYVFQKNGDRTDVSFAVSAQSGHVDMYISQEVIPGTDRVRFPALNSAGYVDRKTYTWHVRRSNSQVLKLHPTMPKYCVNCNYVVAVYNRAQGTARYQVSGTTSKHTTALIEGVPHAATVSAGEYSYFRFPVANRIDGYLNVLVMPTSGDAELSLYVGFGAKDAPTSASYDVKSEELGAECIYVPLADHCVGGNIENGECVAYFGVHASSASTGSGEFKILAELDNNFNNSISLSAGHPMMGCARSAGFTYYEHQIDKNSIDRVTITLTPLSLTADPDLYVTIGERRMPTRSKFDFRSFRSDGEDVVVVQKGDPHFIQHCSSNSLFCTVNIAVYGFKPASFIITISTGVEGGETFLLPGVQVSGIVGKGKYDYYHFSSAAATEDITIVLDAPSGGDPDLLVSNTNDETNLPLDGVPTTYQWSERSRGGGFLYIAHTDKNFKANNDFVIGVHGYSNASYTLLVTIGVKPTRLMPGVQVQGKALASNFKYYYVNRGDSERDVIVSVMPMSGKPVLYVTANKDNTLPSNKYGTYTHSSRSSQLQTRNSVIMRNQTDIPPGVDTILIGVYGHGGASSFKIRAGLCGSEETLLDGHSYQNLGLCSQGNMNQYTYQAPVSAGDAWGTCTIEFAVSTIWGTPTLAIKADGTGRANSDGSYKRPVCKTEAGKVSCDDAVWVTKIGGDGKFSLLLEESHPCGTAVGSKSQNVSCCSTDNSKNPECRAELLGANRRFFVSVYSPDKPAYGLAVTRRCFGSSHAPTIVALEPNSVGVAAQTFPYPFCDMEDRDSRGEYCKVSKGTRQSAFFQFSVSKTTMAQAAGLSITISPPLSRGGTHIPKKLSLYILKCLESVCSQRVNVPGPNQRHNNLLGEMIPPDPLTFFLDGDLQCSPSETDNCRYYVGVYGNEDATGHIPFEIGISTGGQRNVPVPFAEGRVILAGGHEQLVCGSGDCLSSLSYIVQGDSKHQTIHTALELCKGTVVVETCTKDAAETDNCKANADPALKMRAISGDSPDQAMVQRTHDTKGGMTYMTAYGNGAFRLYIDRGCPGCKSLTTPATEITIEQLTSHIGVKMVWDAPSLSSQGRRRYLAGSGLNGAAYVLYLVEAEKPGELEDFVMVTVCGLQRLAAEKPDLTAMVPLTRKAADARAYEASDLKPNTKYRATILAICDKECQAGNENVDTDCDDRSNVKCAVYKQIDFVTGGKPSAGLGPWIVVLIVVSVVAVVLLGFLGWRKKVALEQREQYQMQDVTGMHLGIDSLNKFVGKKNSKYESLINEDGALGDYDGESDSAGLITHF